MQMKKIESRRARQQPRLAFVRSMKNRARVLSCWNFLLIPLTLSLPAWSPAATTPSKAGLRESQSAAPVRAIAAPHELPIVTNTNDNGSGSLRQALVDAQDGDTITFDFSSAPVLAARTSAVTIALTSGELVIDKNISISGPGAGALTISRGTNATPFRIFHVMPGHTVTIAGVTIRGGDAQGSFLADAGGGIYNDHSILTVNGCALTGNHANSYGAGIFNDGHLGSASLTITTSTLNENVCAGGGGGICNFGESAGQVVLAISNTTLSGNSSVSGGGGVMNDGVTGSATLSVVNSTFNNNTALNGFGGGSIYNNGNLARQRDGGVRQHHSEKCAGEYR